MRPPARTETPLAAPAFPCDIAWFTVINNAGWISSMALRHACRMICLGMLVTVCFRIGHTKISRFVYSVINFRVWYKFDHQMRDPRLRRLLKPRLMA
ncbi:hypothetical protein A33O_22157 [Nitratireductor aquibiodomus RA22]|uniref:Uncharacterized protein n=1 Tax=Nitratireductor aquibiodomus RA22 TaxID=1189611 RepID=I5BQM5_9HYPH|nr:hypothetical protein A33O_22157 [Nitratireductor aquibiodomus RA22]